MQGGRNMRELGGEREADVGEAGAMEGIKREERG